MTAVANRTRCCLPDAESERSVLRFGPAGEFGIRLAESSEDRRRAWALAYRVYLEKEYAKPNPQELWYSIFDALPQTVTVLIERGADLIGAVTVVPDSALGLPADATFPKEIARMRAEGRRLAEAISLVQAGASERSGMLVVAKLCELACLVARKVLNATELLCTVNPRHEDYYRRIMLFERRGEEANCEKVQGAPAVFLTLNFADMTRHVEECRRPDAPRTIYRRFMSEDEAEVVARRLCRQRRHLEVAAIRRFFVVERPLLIEATAMQKAHILQEYPAYDLGAGEHRWEVTFTLSLDVDRQVTVGAHAGARG